MFEGLLIKAGAGVRGCPVVGCLDCSSLFGGGRGGGRGNGGELLVSFSVESDGEG